MLLVTYAAVLVAVVLLGAHTHKFISMNHTRTQLIMSFVSGIMLGIAVFHLLPHALYASIGKVSIDFVALSLMVGLVAMFLLQRVFHFHQHDFEEPVAAAGEHHLPIEHSDVSPGYANGSETQCDRYNNLEDDACRLRQMPPSHARHDDYRTLPWCLQRI